MTKTPPIVGLYCLQGVLLGGQGYRLPLNPLPVVAPKTENNHAAPDFKDPAVALTYRLNVRMTEAEGQQLE